MLYENESFQLNPEKMPKHVAIIMDGNGRWATKRGLPRKAGHKAGAEALERIIYAAKELGLEHLTVYAFSTENWKRPEDEVSTLMKLLKSYLKDCIKRSNKNNMRVRVLGDMKGLSQELQDKITELEEVSAKNTGLNFQVAINYGGRDEIIRAVKHMVHDFENNKITIDEIDDKMMGRYLDTKDIPDPDLMIRTSGEQRLSNYLLWQLAYSEFYFTDVLWPDFNKQELQKAIEFYNGRERRFGGI